jgi:hypothetical protein
MPFRNMKFDALKIAGELPHSDGQGPFSMSIPADGPDCLDRGTGAHLRP